MGKWTKKDTKALRDAEIERRGTDRDLPYETRNGVLRKVGIMDTEYLNSNALLAYGKGKSDGVEQEHGRIEDMLQEWKRHHDLVVTQPIKARHYAMCIQEILDKLEDSK